MSTGQDLRLVLRQLGASRGYAAACIAMLALALGATSAVFSAVHHILLKPLPIRDPSRVALAWETDPVRGLTIVEVSYRNFRDWRAQSRAFAELAAMGSSNWSVVLDGRGEPVRLERAGVSAEFFGVLGVAPLHGRVLNVDDDRVGTARVVVLNHDTWLRRFGGVPGVVGSVVTLDDRPYTVVGVMPRGFNFPIGAELWTPLVPILRDASATWHTDVLEGRGIGVLWVVGRLRDAVLPQSGATDLDAIARRLPGARAHRPGDPTVVVTPLVDHLFGPARQTLMWLLVAVAGVLVIACANVSGLTLTRAAGRRRDHAVRLALGASRWGLARLWAIETALLTLTGGALGLALAHWMLRAIVALAPPEIPHLSEVAVDLRVAAVTLPVCGLTALACGLVPALHVSRTPALDALAGGGRATADVGSRRARSALVVVQIGLAVVMLVAAGLMTRSFAKLRHLDLGFDPTNVLTIEVQTRSKAAGGDRWFADLLERVAALPDVQAAGALFLRPLAEGPIGLESTLLLEGQSEKVEDRAWEANPRVSYQSVTPGLFAALGMRLHRGRVFDERDRPNTAPVAIVSAGTAARLWPNRDPIGQRLGMPTAGPDGPGTVWRTVVGVVGDARYRGLDDVRLDYYEPSAQASHGVKHLAIRTGGDPLTLAAAVHAQVKALDPRAVLSGITTMDAIFERAMAPWRFTTWMFSLFALVAFVLAAGGLFSLVALTVASRAREFAVRLAVGARPRDVLVSVLSQAGRLGGAGLALGVAAGLAATKLLRSLLFEISPVDLLTFVSVAALVLGVVTAASYLPARRASRLDPMTVLRRE